MVTLLNAEAHGPPTSPGKIPSGLDSPVREGLPNLLRRRILPRVSIRHLGRHFLSYPHPIEKAPVGRAVNPSHHIHSLVIIQWLYRASEE